MSEPEARRRNPMHVAIAALSVALVAVAALIAFLIWGRPAPTVEPSPTQTPSASPTAQTPSQSPSLTTAPSPTAAPSSAPASTPAATSTAADSPAATTTASSTPAASPVAPQTIAPQTIAPQTMMWQGKATFEHFTTEVLQDDANQDAPMIEDKAGLLVEVCATKALEGASTVRISSDPWSLQDADGNVQKAQQGGYEPAFPTDAEYAVGECARGYLTFDYLSVESDYASLVYENGLGDRAVWQFH